jgi:hypothetical protein
MTGTTTSKDVTTVSAAMAIPCPCHAQGPRNGRRDSNVPRLDVGRKKSPKIRCGLGTPGFVCGSSRNDQKRGKA